MQKILKIFFLLTIMLFGLMSCSPVSVSDNGGGTDFPNTKTVSGCIYTDSGTVSPNTIVKLIPESYIPSVSPDSLVHVDTTDSSGNYTFHAAFKGKYNILAFDYSTKKRAFIPDITIDTVPAEDSSPVSVPAGHLKKTGAIVFPYPVYTDRTHGYVYIRGTECRAISDTAARRFILEEVPCGYIPPVIYSAPGDTASKILADSLFVNSSDTLWIDRSRWTGSKKIMINTSISGADCKSTLYSFPLLVKLTSSDFDFRAASSNGEDIRFTDKYGKSLSYQIEQWNKSLSEAIIWVLIDTIYSNNSSQYINMLYGNSAAADSSDGQDVFSTENGFQAVWHLDEHWDDTIRDATRNRFNGMQMGIPDSTVPGLIGRAHKFDGISSSIEIPFSTNGALNFPENGTYTISAWVYASKFDSTFRNIISKSNMQYGIQLFADNRWVFFDVVTGASQGFTDWNGVRANAADSEWVYITGVRNGSSEYLYVNGQFADSTIVTTKTYVRNTFYNVCIGRESGSFSGYWNGNIDEVQMSDVSRGAEWIRLCYMNQKEYARVISVR